MPVRPQADGLAEAGIVERAEVCCPVEDSLAGRRPVDLSFCALMMLKTELIDGKAGPPLLISSAVL